MDRIVYNDRLYEVVQCFDDHVLLQDIDSKNLILIEYQSLHPKFYNINNIYSLEFWRNVKKTKKSKKTTT